MGIQVCLGRPGTSTCASGTSQGVSGQLSDGARICLVTHRLPPLALDLCTGAASISARRRSPVSAADPIARASRRRARQKKGQNYHFFLTHSNGKRRPWQVSEAPKYFGGGVKKKNKIFPPPLHSSPGYHPAASLEPEPAEATLAAQWPRYANPLHTRRPMHLHHSKAREPTSMTPRLAMLRH